MSRRIFNSCFNLGFGTPKSDTCATCDFKSHDITEHTMKAETAFEAQLAENVAVITFDLQEILPLPKLSTSVGFYLRQIWLYNLGVHKSRSEAYFQIWTEADGGRGCSEVGSALLAFFDCAGTAEGRPSHLIPWSDSCDRQTTNFHIVCLWQYLILSEAVILTDISHMLKRW